VNTGEDIALAFCQAEGETLLDGLAERLAKRLHPVAQEILRADASEAAGCIIDLTEAFLASLPVEVEVVTEPDGTRPRLILRR
jgi:hypothetical protein